MNNKNSKKRKNPYRNFVKEQFLEINKNFYENYLKDYFVTKILVYNKQLNDIDTSLEGISIEKLDVELIFKNNTEYKEHIRKCFNTEIAMTTFHCLETFLRLFIVHSKFPPAPVMELRYLSIKEYQRNIENIKNGKFNTMNEELTNDKIIVDVFMGGESILNSYCEKANTTRKKIVTDYKELLKFAANFVSDNEIYNVFKHGLYMRQSQQGFSFGEKFSANGEAFSYVVKKVEEDGTRKWYKRIKWLDLQLFQSLTLIYNHYIDYLVDLWKIILITPHDKELEVKITQSINIKEFVVTQSNGNTVLNSIKQDSLFISQMDIQYDYYK
ncbi:hypothetical protein [Streptococcus oricebi]|nr:hypothetical protein [Streptococcus oricebi]